MITIAEGTTPTTKGVERFPKRACLDMCGGYAQVVPLTIVEINVLGEADIVERMKRVVASLVPVCNAIHALSQGTLPIREVVDEGDEKRE